MQDAAFDHDIEIRFRDCDALGHVNNAVYLSYLEQARIAFWHRLTGTSGIPRGFILARAEIDFTAPATLGDRLVVALRVEAVGRTSFTLAYEVLKARTREVIASARTVQVMFDYGAGKPVPIPDAIRARLEG